LNVPLPFRWSESYRNICRPFGVDVLRRFLDSLDSFSGNCGLYASAAAGAGANLKKSAYRFQSLFHADEAEPMGPGAFNVKSYAIVDNTQLETAGTPSQMHRYFTGPAVLDRVLKCFLYDAEKT
jgi:hypothetical protein